MRKIKELFSKCFSNKSRANLHLNGVYCLYILLHFSAAKNQLKINQVKEDANLQLLSFVMKLILNIRTFFNFYDLPATSVSNFKPFATFCWNFVQKIDLSSIFLNQTHKKETKGKLKLIKT